MSAYVIVDIDVKDPVMYERYKALVPQSIAKYGGRYLARGGRTDVLEGDWMPRRLVILEFQSMDKARQWWESADYAEAKSIRQQSSKATMVVVEGLS